jgi:hypothetical protein
MAAMGCSPDPWQRGQVRRFGPVQPCHCSSPNPGARKFKKGGELVMDTANLGQHHYHLRSGWGRAQDMFVPSPLGPRDSACCWSPLLSHSTSLERSTAPLPNPQRLWLDLPRHHPIRHTPGMIHHWRGLLRAHLEWQAAHKKEHVEGASWLVLVVGQGWRWKSQFGWGREREERERESHEWTASSRCCRYNLINS